MNDIRFNVFGINCNNKSSPIYPLYISNTINAKNGTCDLLLIEQYTVSYYVWIKDINTLMNTQSKIFNRKFFCKYCIQHFTEKGIFKAHTDVCLSINGAQKINLTSPGITKLEYKNYHKQLMAPFVIYADFEAIVEPSNKPFGNSTTSYQNHIACGYKLVCNYDDKYFKHVKVYSGINSIYRLMQDMLKEEKYCAKIMNDHFNKEMKSEVCHICEKKYKDSDYIFNKALRDHCHASLLYRRSAHNTCSRLYRLTKKIPVVFHNLRGYDSHCIMQEIEIKEINKNKDDLVTLKKIKQLEDKKKKTRINVIPINMEKYMAFMVSNLVFIDSLQFLNQSLANLVNNLPSEAFTFTRQCFQDDFELMKRKRSLPIRVYE
ncbi:hypothetical protein MAR_027847 [Mya arenaria]|uniref:DNA-directed DNA polymerase n=1 Tax=Mya arenaria TaxID=6604 RepID=A0ABY7EWP1_MYAAR|nr:hypothetical protein MAR_027847 [Mya arenaria]